MCSTGHGNYDNKGNNVEKVMMVTPDHLGSNNASDSDLSDTTSKYFSCSNGKYDNRRLFENKSESDSLDILKHHRIEDSNVGTIHNGKLPLKRLHRRSLRKIARLVARVYHIAL